MSINGHSAQTQTLQLRVTPRIIPGVRNELVFANAATGDYVGRIEMDVVSEELIMPLVSGFVQWMAEHQSRIATASAAALAGLPPVPPKR